jgi:hypothetical protein
MDTFGVKNCSGAFFALFINMEEEKISEIKQLLNENSLGECVDLNEHLEF